MSLDGQVWTSQSDITQTALHIPIFEAFFDTQTFSGKQYYQKLSYNNKVYYLNHTCPNSGTYIRDNSEIGTFKYIRGVLTFNNSSGSEVEKFTNNHGTEIDSFNIKDISN